MKRLRSLAVLLALVVSACRGGGRVSSSLPQADGRLLLQTASGLYVIATNDGSVAQWQPRGSAELDIWPLTPDDYRHFIHDNAVIFVNGAGDYARHDLGETHPQLLSPDGRHATRLIDGDAVIWRIDQSEADAQIVGAGARSTGYWSADGRRLVFITTENGTDRHVMHDVTSGEQTLLAESEGAIRFPQWSADGAFYSFVAIGNDGLVLHQVAVASQQVYRIELPMDELTGLHHAGESAAFIGRSRDGDFSHLHYIDPTRGVVRQLYETRYFIKETIVSPDESSILIVTDNWGAPQTLDLLHVSLENGGVIGSRTIDAPFVLDAAFAPGGEQIALRVGSSAGPSRLLVWDGVAGSAPQLMSDLAVVSTAAFVWSADGESIYAAVATEEECTTRKKFSIALVPTFVDDVRCQMGVVQISADGQRYERVEDFRTPISAELDATLFWLP